MKNFNELTENAARTADARTKAYTELKKSAPGLFEQYIAAMKKLGYKNSFFTGKLFHDQVEFVECYSEEKASYLELDFGKMAFIEATDEEIGCKGEIVNIYDGTEYPIDFSKNTNGKVLLAFLKSLPQRLESCTKKAEDEINSVNEFLANK
jgi:hypothetical protein